ncbi:protein of unknown function [Bradyrhizobium vignae]|uniref:Uncharacterized protein n=1 Tax=Bradyrhizobium vignae TaxID=1549949 RepID=A0A2U3Q6N6_9BRAD|nr:protein of unknown function [Bradyrhizobium vignae]
MTSTSRRCFGPTPSATPGRDQRPPVAPRPGLALAPGGARIRPHNDHQIRTRTRLPSSTACNWGVRWPGRAAYPGKGAECDDLARIYALSPPEEALALSGRLMAAARDIPLEGRESGRHRSGLVAPSTQSSGGQALSRQMPIDPSAAKSLV